MNRRKGIMRVDGAWLLAVLFVFLLCFTASGCRGTKEDGQEPIQPSMTQRLPSQKRSMPFDSGKSQKDKPPNRALCFLRSAAFDRA